MRLPTTSRRFGAGLLIAVAAVLLTSTSALAETKTFTYTGKEQEFKVPAGVTSVHVVAVGSAGEQGYEGAAGGVGAIVSGNLTVKPEQLLYVEVGGIPFNGGGSGLEEINRGGGASDVRTVSIGTEPSPGDEESLNSRLLIAAGGGGGGKANFRCPAGAGGGPEEKGAPGANCGSRPGEGGGGGEAGKGGAGGAGYFEEIPDPAVDGEAGRLGVGGQGALRGDDGGNGGGGRYGGGGGGTQDAETGTGATGGSGGGGGGSNLVPAGGEAKLAPGEAPSVTFTYTLPSTTLTTSLSGEGKKGEKITVNEGEAVSDRATLSGENAAKATGTVSYKVFSDNECTKLVKEAGTVTVTAGSVPESEAQTLSRGTYYWQASYSGDELNEKSTSTCGSEVETVTAKPATCGKTTIGKSSDTLVSNEKRVNACVLPINATMSELSVYLAPTSFSGKQLIKGMVYSSSGKPATRLGVTKALTFKSSYPPGWYHLLFARPLKLSAGSYWIGIITGEASRVAGERYDSLAKAEDYNANTYTSGPSKTFGAFSTTDEQMSLYATYLPE